jgi:hypothetical protein
LAQQDESINLGTAGHWGACPKWNGILAGLEVPPEVVAVLFEGSFAQIVDSLSPALRAGQFAGTVM